MWLFDGKTLSSPLGQNWVAKSGPYGKGKLPNGLYTIGSCFEVRPPNYQNGAYKGMDNFAWFCRLEPQFETDRTGLGIHPDGNKPGTKGCVGILNTETRGLFQQLMNNRGEKLKVSQ
ncbi:MAG: hypothetical protein OEZ58_20435 [Gammaproteobacteria bacterium]|nr:hypothetical protein [Gammaproteobacteria bacterium]